jgi:hypothetical protein
MSIRYSLPAFGLLAVLSGSGLASLGWAEERASVLPASPEEAHQQKEVFSFLKDYFSALAQGEVEKLAIYHPSLTPEQLALLRNYFAHTVRDLYIHLQDVHVQVAANTATVAFRRTDRFVDRPTSRPVEKHIRLSTLLVQGANGWRLAGLDQVAFALGDRTMHAS